MWAPITLTETIVAEMIDAGQHSASSVADLSVEVVYPDEELTIVGTWHAQLGAWVTDNLLDTVFLYFKQVRWHCREIDIMPASGESNSIFHKMASAQRRCNNDGADVRTQQRRAANGASRRMSLVF